MQGNIPAATQVMWYEYFDIHAMDAKIQEAPMIYKGTERLCGDPTYLRKKVEDYGSLVSTYLFLKKSASLCHHPKS